MSSPAVSKTANSTIDKNLKGYLPTLDGWRAIAIMAVLLDHATTREWLQKIQYFRTGPNGVSLFFAISGYLICSRLLEEESARGRISLKDFYIRRACRILPPAYFFPAITFPIMKSITAGVVLRSTTGHLQWKSIFIYCGLHFSFCVDAHVPYMSP